MNTRVSFRFSLRQLLAVTLVIAIVLAWWAEQARETKWLAAELRRHGVGVTYEVERRRSRHTVRWFVRSYQPPLYDRLFLGLWCKWPEFFSHISGVTVNSGALTPEVRHCLQRLPGLWSLHVAETDFDDSDLRSLTCSHALQHLNCENTLLSDAGMIPLARFTELRTLDLQETRVSDVGLMQLIRLKNLETLRIGGWDPHPADGSSGRQRISAEAVERLRAALPNCSIVGSWGLPQP